MNLREKPIGVFDSGLGGISVVRSLMEILPREQFIYFGDTARVPYGSKSAATVRRFSRQITHFLLAHEVKLIVVACNTASAVALDVLRKEFDLPIVGVIEPGAEAAVSRSPSRRIGVIGTTSTIRSEAYAREIHSLDPRCLVLSQACPLLVPLVEEDWPEDEVVEKILNRYLGPFQEASCESLILGCTHYPYLRSAIEQVVGPEVQLIDSGAETARSVTGILDEMDLACEMDRPGIRHRFYVSDFPQMFRETASRFLGRPLENLFQVELEHLESLSS